MPDHPAHEDDDDGQLQGGGERPLGESLLGSSQSGGLAGQGGMVGQGGVAPADEDADAAEED